MFKRNFTNITMIIVILNLVFWGGCSKKEDNVVRIGAILPLTGAAANPGNTAKNGLLLAGELYNIRIEIEDSKSNPKDGLNGFRKIISNKSNLIGVISLMSGVCRSVIPIAETEKIPTFHVASYPDLVKDKKYAFRWYITSKDQMQHIINYLEAKNMVNKKMIFIHTNDDYGLGAFQAFKELLQLEVDKIDVNSISYNSDEKNFRNIISEIKKANPEIIITVGYSTNLGLLIRQLKEQKINADIVSDDAVSYPDILESAGNTANGIIFPGLPIEKLSEESQFFNEYQKKYSTNPDDFATFAFGIVKIINDCLKKNKNYRIDDLINCLEKESFDTPLGKIKFDNDHNGNVPLVMKYIKDQSIYFFDEK